MPSNKRISSKKDDISGWYKQLKKVRLSLEATPDSDIHDDHLKDLGIELSNLDLDSDKAPDSRPRFFAPFPREQLKHSTCALEPAQLLDKHPLRKFKWEHIDQRRDEHYHPCKWKSAPHQREWEVSAALKITGENKPHTFLILQSGNNCENKNLLKSEVTTMVSFMRASMRSDRQPRSKSHRHRLQTIFPVFIVSILNSRHTRFLQGYFDGMLKIQCSEIYDLDSPCYEKSMNLFACWMSPATSGITAWIPSLPAIKESSEEELQDH